MGSDVLPCGRSGPRWNVTDSMAVVRGSHKCFRVVGEAEKPVDTATWLH